MTKKEIKIKVLVVENSGLIGLQMQNYLNRQKNLRLTGGARNVEEAIAFFQIEKPDVIIFDISSFGVKGLSSLEKLVYHSSNSLNLILLLEIEDDNIFQKAKELVRSFRLNKPFTLDSLYARIIEINENNKPQYECNFDLQCEIENKITFILFFVGIPANIIGFNFLLEAVKAVINNPKIINNITKILYPEIAKKFFTKPTRVERAIRYAICVAWEKKGFKNLKNLDGQEIYKSLKQPRNGELIAMIAEKIKLEIKKEK